MNKAMSLSSLLLVEPQFVLRRTIVAVAHDLGLARFQEATGSDSARQWLASQRFDGLVVDVGGGPAVLDLLSRLRQGEFLSDRQTPILAMTSGAAGPARDESLEWLDPVLLLRKPFKVAELLQMLPRMRVCAEA